jgi:hypothetical protein
MTRYRAERRRDRRRSGAWRGNPWGFESPLRHHRKSKRESGIDRVPFFLESHASVSKVARGKSSQLFIHFSTAVYVTFDSGFILRTGKSDFLRLAPEFQKQILSLSDIVRKSAVTERRLRPIIKGTEGARH